MIKIYSFITVLLFCLNLKAETKDNSINSKHFVISNKGKIIKYEELIGKNFHEYLDYKYTYPEYLNDFWNYFDLHCSFLRYSDMNNTSMLSFYKDSLSHGYGEIMYNVYRNFKEDKKENKIVVSQQSDSYTYTWTVSYCKNGLIRTDGLEGMRSIFIGEDQMDSFECVYPYKTIDGSESYYHNSSYNHYFILKEDKLQDIRIISNINGCPLRKTASTQSNMLRYLLINEPVCKIKQVNKHWVKVEDIFGNIGYLLSRDIKLNNLYHKTYPNLEDIEEQ